MFRLCFFIWSCPRKPKHLSICLTWQHLHSFSSAEHIGENFPEHKVWKSVKKNDPHINDILQLPETKQRVSVLSNLMKCEEDLAKALIVRDRRLVASKSVLEKIQLLTAHGFNADDVIACPAVLHRSLELIKNRLHILEAVPWLEATSLNHIKQSSKMFDQFLKRYRNDINIMKGFTSRAQFLAKLFDCDEKTAALLIETNELLLSVSPALISKKVNTLLKYQISLEFIRKNIRILFRVPDKELDLRCSLLQEKQLLNSGLHLKLCQLLTCSSQEFSTAFNSLCKRKESLEGCKDRLEYVSLRLHCNESTAKHFLNCKCTKRVSETKLKQVLDFLLQELKMDASLILKHKLLFDYSLDRLKYRWAVLFRAGFRDVRMLPSVLVLSNEEFSKKFGSFVYVDTFNVSED